MIVLLAAIACLAFVVCFGMVLLIRPLLVRHALARPNARSSHRIPTPQGGGIAVVVGVLVVTGLVCSAAVSTPPFGIDVGEWWLLAAAVSGLAVVGWIDDIRPLPVMPRLAAHFVAVGGILFALPADVRIVDALPVVVERGLLLVVGVYVVNIVNFMDGLDWMTVAEFVPVCVGVLVVAWLGDLPPLTTAVAAALGGALAGFAPFNRPVAKLFLGDVGSLPLGLLMFWMLFHVAAGGYWAAAILLPLYYLMDASVTLLRRIARREAIHQAHRSHVYQRATDLGWSVPAIVASVFAVNVGLVALAAWTVLVAAPTSQVIAVVLGLALVAGLLWRLSQEPV